MNKNIGLVLLALFLLFNSCASTKNEIPKNILGRVVYAQSEQGVMEGTVRLYKASTENENIIISEIYVENTSGLFSIPFVENGRYKIQAFPPQESSYRPSEIQEITVSAGECSNNFILLELLLPVE